MARRGQRHARHGAPRPLGALHRRRVAACGAGRAQRAPPGHAGTGQGPQPHPHGPGEAELRRDGGVEARGGRGAGTVGVAPVGPGVAAGGDGRGGRRRRGAVPEPRAVRPRARLDRARRPRWARTRAGDRDRPCLQRLDGRLLQCEPAAAGRRSPRAPRRRRRRRRGAPRHRIARVRDRLHAARPGQRAGVERSRLRPDLAHVRAARGPVLLPRRRSELPAARLHARVRQPHDVAHLRTAGRDHGRDREHDGRRRAPAVPRPARRPARRELRMGAVVARSPRRALGVGGRQGRARARSGAVGVLPIELLPEHRGRRASRRATTSTGSATTTSCSRPTTRTATRSSPRRCRRSWSFRSTRTPSARSCGRTGAGCTGCRRRPNARTA